MKSSLSAWAKSGNPAADSFKFIAKKLKSKVSNKYSKESVHNFMHNKVVVCDNAVYTGSFNLSNNATKNAENSLLIRDAGIADQYVKYIDALIGEYGSR
jgi:phosphatidylserine/phosphatidylglycerophosphate/cardiolipin synthase-like enzyme